MSRTSLWILSIYLCQFTVLAQVEPNGRLDAQLRQQRLASHQTMISGNPAQAAIELLNSVRALPTDDPTITERAVGNFQLLLFDVNHLMTDQMRNDFFSETLNVTESELDSFIVTLHESSLRKTPQQMEAFLTRLWDFGQSSNELIAPIALGLAANPYYSADSPIGESASTLMATRYPNLESTREVMLAPIYKRRERPSIAAEWIRAYKSKANMPGVPRIREVTEPEKAIAEEDAVLTKLEPALNLLGQSERKKEGVTAFISLIDESNDWKERYTYIRMLEPEMKARQRGVIAQGYWKHIKPSMERLANSNTLTPDVYRARVILCRVAADEGRYTEARKWAENILTQQDRVCEHPERIFYEEAVKTYLHFAKSFYQRSHPENAAGAYERLADYYPNSQLALDCQKLAAETLASAE